MENLVSNTSRYVDDNSWSDNVTVTQMTSVLPLGEIQYIYVTVTVFYVLVFLLGLLGNILVISVVCGQRDMRTPTNMFLVNLSVADLLVLFFCMPSSLAEFHAQEAWLLGETMCKLTFFLEHAVAHTSILTILAISFERYYAICCPLQVLYTCTLQRAVKINVCVWCCGLLSAVPFILLAFTESVTHATEGQVDTCRLPVKSTWSKTYVIAIQQLFFTIPCLVLAALYVIICRALLKDPLQLSSKNLEPNSSPEQEALTSHTLASTQLSMITGALNKNWRKSNTMRRRQISLRRQIVYLVITIMVLFFVCLLPLKVVTLWLIYSPEEDKECLGLEGYMNLMAFVRIMFYLNSAGNPILYSLVSTKFRQAGRRLVCSKGKTSHAASFTCNNYNISNHRVRSSRAKSAATTVTEFQRIASAVDNLTITTATQECK